MSAQSSYRTFAELAGHEPEGESWERLAVSRPSPLLVAAPHGGGIEQGTTEIARAVADENFSLYGFVGLKERGNGRLHLPSTRFDDPVFLELAAGARVVVAVHGSRSAGRRIALGGRHDALARRIAAALQAVGFEASFGDERHPGAHPRNLCNRGRDGRGVQLEISRGLRLTLFRGLRALERQSETDLFARFVSALRRALLEFERELLSGAGPAA